MKAVLSIELIGDDVFYLLQQRKKGQRTKTLPLRKEIDLIKFSQPKYRTWVARIIDTNPTGTFKREFLKEQSRDYSHANSTGSKGIVAYYVLSDGIYEVNRREGREDTKRYFVRAQNGKTTEINSDEVMGCLKNAT